MRLDINASVLVIDDDQNFIQLLATLLADIGIQQIRSTTEPQAAFEIIQQERPDLAIIDYDLKHPNYNGISIGKYLKEHHPECPMIFMTSHFTTDVYRECRPLTPSSFMNKDLSHLKIMQAVDIALFHHKPAVLEDSKSAKPDIPFLQTEHFFFKVGDKYQSFRIKEVQYFFAKDKLTYAKIQNRNYPTSVQLKVIEEVLYPKFLRIHKSYLIQRSQIERVLPKENKVQVNEELLPIGYAYRKAFLRDLKVLK